MKTIWKLTIGALAGCIIQLIVASLIYKAFRSVNDKRLDKFNAEQYAEKIKKKASAKVLSMREYLAAIYLTKKAQIEQVVKPIRAEEQIVIEADDLEGIA
jgi:hypothetical protein